jgi:hydrogenase maturation protein HypF
VALLDELFGAEAAELAARLGLPDPGEVLQLVRADLRSPRAHGAGRWFDAFAVVALGRHVASFEGQLAMALEATGRDRVGPPLHLDDPSDLRPAFAEAVDLRLAGADPGELSARIHATFAAAGRALLEAARHETGARWVALAGGCFQSERLVGLLADDNTLRAARVPPNDGGLSLGQAWVAGRTR